MDVSYDNKLYTVDFDKVGWLRTKSTMQNVIIKVPGSEHKVIIGINRKRNPHKLYILTTDKDLAWRGNRS